MDPPFCVFLQPQSANIIYIYISTLSLYRLLSMRYKPNVSGSFIFYIPFFPLFSIECYKRIAADGRDLLSFPISTTKKKKRFLFNQQPTCVTYWILRKKETKMAIVIDPAHLCLPNHIWIIDFYFSSSSSPSQRYLFDILPHSFNKVIKS